MVDKKTDSDWVRSSCSHTDAGMESTNGNGRQHGPAWWSVDLGAVGTIMKVNVWHRTDWFVAVDGRQLANGRLLRTYLCGFL